MSAYCNLQDVLDIRVPQDAIDDLDTDLVTRPNFQRIIEKRSAIADGYLPFTLPLVTWGPDLRLVTSLMVSFDIMSVRTNPEQPEGMVWVNKQAEALKWLQDVARGSVKPVGVTDSSEPPATASTGWYAASEPSRGW